MHASDKKCEKIKGFWKIWKKIFEFLTKFFWKFDQKTLKSEKYQTFKKVIFDARNVLLGQNLLLADIF